MIVMQNISLIMANIIAATLILISMVSIVFMGNSPLNRLNRLSHERLVFIYRLAGGR